MATKRKDYEEEINPRYTANTARLAGRNDAAHQTEKAAQAAYDAVKGEGTPARFGTYKTPEERLAEQVAYRENAAESARRAQETGAADMPTPTAGTGAGAGAGTGSAGVVPNTSAGTGTGTKPITAESKLADILNGEKFSYNLNADPTFQTLLAQYRREGKGAMRDTMAQATALTGGYANSAAQAAAQQAYDRRMDEAFEQVPELEAAAYARYRDDRADLYNEYSILAAREAAENEEMWRNKEWDLQLERYRVADEQWAADHDLDVAKFEESKNQFKEQMALDWANMTLREKEYALDKWYKEQGVALNKAELAEKAREFDEEMNLSYYQEQNDIGYKYAALKQDNDQFYESLYAKSGGGGSGGGGNNPNSPEEEAEEEDEEEPNFTGSVSLKTDKDWNAAVNKTAAEMRKGTFKLSSLYKYTYKQAVALIKRANDLNDRNATTKSTLKGTR